MRAYNAAILGIVQSKVNAGKRVHLVDMYKALTPADLADGVHPNAGGYDKMADVWVEGAAVGAGQRRRLRAHRG
ncbi:hypothetical protein SANTM175S_00158 [Streptomyces antimycoticus]